ncbi:MAG TPA: 2-dehydropantoate 2-reductase [Stellaceae bacterium]|nr:2-dehydropantoate 2-reductase [Stellaceae bacterium]
MRVLVLGAGALGGYFGGRLAAAGAEITFLVRPARQAALNERGLVVESPLGDLRLPVATATADTIAGPFDTILLTAKAYDLEAAIAAIGPAVGPDSAILPLLNGLRHLDRLGAAFGAGAVLGGVAYIGATLTHEGVIRHLTRSAALAFGERSGELSARVQAIAALFAAAGIDATASEAILFDMWEKFVMITALAGMTSMMRGSVGEIMEAAKGESLMLELIAECERVAAASGYPPRPRPRAQYRALLTERGSDFSASMRRDLEAGARTEADAILGDMLHRARAHGLSTPLLAAALCHLDVHERRLARQV